MTASQARTVLAGLPDAGAAVWAQMRHRRHFEAHRLLTLALGGDKGQATEVMTALIKDSIMKR